jgi:hypothetical protein
MYFVTIISFVWMCGTLVHNHPFICTLVGGIVQVRILTRVYVSDTADVRRGDCVDVYRGSTHPPSASVGV